MAGEAALLPKLRIRGRSFMAFILVPELPVRDWLVALDAQMERAPGYFARKPMIVNFSALQGEGGDPAALLYALDMRGLSLIGVEGIERSRLGGTRFEALLDLRQKSEGDDQFGRDIALPEEMPKPVPASASLIIDRPVRSGQSIVFEDGDVTIIGSVASGAEVVAGGSLHVYGTVRGRLVAGVKTGAAARIFCGRLSAELVAIDGIYGTADDWNEHLDGRAVQIRQQDGALKITALD
ncbi:MAG: septum site-determining protein MinC [Rhodospirillales bacterium]|nr:septum site-determining protein MinC [Rhodospirillales bacterium]